MAQSLYRAIIPHTFGVQAGLLSWGRGSGLRVFRGFLGFRVFGSLLGFGGLRSLGVMVLLRV